MEEESSISRERTLLSGVLTVVWGTRPDSIKLGPIVAALKARKIPLCLICTGQHTTLLHGSPALTDLTDSHSLEIDATGEITRWLRYAETPLQVALRGSSLVVVQGDTMSAIAGARAADQLGIPVAHVEAGVRSGDLQDPWPEEGFRREITQLARWHYAPTAQAADALAAESVDPASMILTGNSVVSAIARYADVQPVPVPDLTVLFTMHRREWRLQGIKSVLEGFALAASCYPELELVWPMHPAVARDIPPSWVLNLPPNAKICEPLAYRPTLRLLVRSLGVATDSGGLQEESATLGVPCAVLRYKSDRGESIEAGVARCFPPTGEGIMDAIHALRERTILRRVSPVFGDRLSADRIASHLAQVEAGQHVILADDIETVV